MPVFVRRRRQFKPPKDVEVQWDSFKGGWNNIFRPTELKENELTQADNLMLIGEGVPTGRWGSEKYFLAGENGRIRLLDSFVVPGSSSSLASTNYLLSITDDGYLVKKSGASYAMITGASFASGYSYQSVQLGLNTYISAGSLPLVRFDGTSLIPYVALSVPTNVSLAQLSTATGTTTFSWLITALSRTGETMTSVSKSLASMPLDLSETLIKVTWNTVSAASGILQGYNIYRGFPGDESYVGSTDRDSTSFLDEGNAASNTVLPPTHDTTSGPRARYSMKFDDRVILAGVEGDPSRVYISGRYPYHDRFNAADGGGYILIAPDDGDEITGLGIAGNQGMSTGGSAPPASAILVFKKNSVHRVVLTTVQIGNFLILDPSAQILTSSNGCSSADTVMAVENDTFYFGRKGLYTVGQEPNFINQIRTNEISARIRSYIRNLSKTDFDEACAGYIDNKYLLSFPTKKETVIYDRERAAFMGPWKTPWGITKWYKYIDTTGVEKWLAGTTPETGDSPYVRDFSDAYVSDSGTAISKVLRTKKEDLDVWSVMKVLKLFYVLFRNVKGQITVNLRIETKDGSTVTTKNFTISSQLGTGGWGSDQTGTRLWGTSEATVVLTGDEIVRWAQIYKQSRVVQVEVISTAANANFEFLGVRFTGQGMGDQSLPASTRV